MGCRGASLLPWTVASFSPTVPRILDIDTLTSSQSILDSLKSARPGDGRRGNETTPLVYKVASSKLVARSGFLHGTLAPVQPLEVSYSPS